MDKIGNKKEKVVPAVKISPSEVEKRLKAWADVTMLCLELKKAFLRKRYPELNETEISELIRKEHEIAEGYPNA